MAKIQYPPQGGEKKICLSLCWMALCCVISAVLMIYFTAIIYIPGANVLQSKIEGKDFKLQLCTLLINNTRDNQNQNFDMKKLFFMRFRWEKMYNIVDGKGS